jgi:putative transposase
MSRQPRIEYQGACYHVMARGDRREAIVTGDEDRKLFLETMEEAIQRTGWKVHAWILMDNHYHWALETPEPNLVAGMKWFQNTYTRRINTRHRLWGHVFGGRYKSIVIEPEAEDSGEPFLYLGTLIDYIHLNPIRARMVRTQEGKGLLDYAWSSLSQAYAISASKRPAWMEIEKGLAARNLQDTVFGRQRYVKILEDIAQGEAAKRCGYREIEGQSLNSTLQRGWYWGSEAFKEKLLGMAGKKKPGNRNYKSSAQGKAKREEEAQEWIEKGQRHFEIGEEELDSSKGSYGPKVAIAWALHRRTTISQGWIAQRLRMKSAANVSQQIRRWTPEGAKARQWKELVKNC